MFGNNFEACTLIARNGNSINFDRFITVKECEIFGCFRDKKTACWHLIEILPLSGDFFGFMLKHIVLECMHWNKNIQNIKNEVFVYIFVV